MAGKSKKKKQKKTGAFGGRDAKNRANRLIFFCIKFFLIFFVLEYLIDITPLSALTDFIAFLTGRITGFVVLGSTVFAGSQAFIVTNSCTGFVSASVLAAIVFSLRKPKLVQKTALFIAGLAVLFVINIPRVALVVYSASLGLDANLVHVATWFLMSALVLGIWYYGTKRIAKVKEFSELL